MSNISRNSNISSSPRQEMADTPESLAVLEAMRSPHERSNLGAQAAALKLSVSFIPTQHGDYRHLDDVTLSGLECAFFTKHHEQTVKDQNGFISAKTEGGVGSANVVNVCALGYDFDNTRSIEEIHRVVRESGHVCTTYSTYNHGRDKQRLDGKHVAANMKQRNDSSGTPLSDQDAQAYCAGKPKFATLKNVRVLHGGEIQHDEKGPYWEIAHDPEVRVRVIIWLRTPIPISEVGIDGYKRLYRAFGDKLFGAGTYDSSCQNPSRIFWLPAKHPESTVDHFIETNPGDLFDWRPLWETLSAEVLAQRERARVTHEARLKDREAGDNLKDVAECLQRIPATVEHPVWFRALAAIHYESGGSEAGLSLAHEWSATAPELYDENEVERLWEYFDSSADNGGGKVTLRTLVHLARKFAPARTIHKTIEAPVVVPGWRKHFKRASE